MVEKHVISKQQLADLLMLTEGHFFELDTRKNRLDFALVVTHSAELAVSEPGSR